MDNQSIMKKNELLFIGVFICTLMLTSCGSNESVVEEPASVEFAKTTEMLNFESSLKDYFQSKRESLQEDTKKAIETKVVKDANVLLQSLGKESLAKKPNDNTDLFVRTALKAYSEKLTEMYHEQIKN